jgi:hypothetical protein
MPFKIFQGYADRCIPVGISRYLKYTRMKNPVVTPSGNDRGNIFAGLPDQGSSLWSAGQKLQIE